MHTRRRSSSFRCTIPWRRVRLERAEQLVGNRCNRFDRSKECCLVNLRRLVEAAYLAYELQGGFANLFRSRRRLVIEEGLDVSAHHFT